MVYRPEKPSLVFDIKQAIFLDGIVSSHQRFEVERSFLLRGQGNLIECKNPLQGLLRCATCEEDASLLFQTYNIL